ncbi:proton-coupled folate transporter [Strongylocentrotus purpuratus]|uniref:Proton-coupled folate transporter n=1 Tax=Strongylocentrotus purpuratus TaxID=7668 RepID=A0A7M7PEU5_STRPU|nr:proton-coupled folate transporter [Strongylocentrotus purpuratus]XP_030849292.1 proton-coupled folate transporter [Strongylocentrotus purpuratus]XP_030849293.1 proton-coupled folate transporter [Strongylocentrotus purpuratus]XP_030849294.1 proton-coupled folate transporter [Strongylocentrotus purpuratus]
MEADNSTINSSGVSSKPSDVADHTEYASSPAEQTTQCQDVKFEGQHKRAVSRYITVEVPLALTVLTYQLIATMKAEYLHDRLSAKYNHSLIHNSSASTCGPSTNLNESHIGDMIQAETSTWLLYLGLAYSIPGVFMAILVGSLSDTFGRKPALCLNIIGSCLLSTVYLFIVYYQAPVEYLLIGDFISGVTGGQALLLSTGAAYVADVTSEKSRTPRIIFLETIFFIGMGAGQISLGTALQYSPDHSFRKYLAPLWLALGCALASLVYTVLPNVLIETVDRRNRRKSVGVRVLVSGIVDIIRINNNGRRLKVIMYTVVMICIVITAKCQSQLTIVYSLGEPFCFNPLMVSILTVVGLSIQALGMIFSGAVLGRILSENWILQLSFWNTGLFFLIVALAQKGFQLFIAAGIGVFGAICFPVVRSQLSKLASEHERGLMLAFVGCMDSIGTLLTPIILNNIYSETVSFYPPLVFFFSAAFEIIPTVCVGILQCRHRREVKYHVINRENIEEHSEAQ